MFGMTASSATSRDDTYDVFVCHAGEDKKTVALPLAEELRARGYRVWIDAFELKVGDSLRRKIDAGIAGSRYGIVIVSPAFFGKEWPQKELDALVTLEDTRGGVVLPIWHGVSYEVVLRYSPILASKKAASTDNGLPAVIESLAEVLDADPARRPTWSPTILPLKTSVRMFQPQLLALPYIAVLIQPSLWLFSPALSTFILVSAGWPVGWLAWALSVWARRRRLAVRPSKSAFVVLALLGMLAAGLGAALGIAALPPIISESTFVADFSSWHPEPSDVSGYPDVRVPTSLAGEVETIHVYQAALYTMDVKFGPHLGGSYNTRFSVNTGRVDATIEAPGPEHVLRREMNSDRTPQGAIRHYTVYEIGLWGVDRVRTKAFFYNGFSIDHHTYGFPILFRTRRAGARFDFSKLDIGRVFAATHVPRIVLQRYPYQPLGEMQDVTDRSDWDKGVLKAEVHDAPAGAALILDCEWMKTGNN